MKFDILFLDIDGVLNPDKSRSGASFDPVCAAELKRFFAAQPDTKVVLSTSWRLGFSLFALGWQWHQHGLPFQAVIGRTPGLAPDQRGQEVSQWLKDVPAVHLGCNVRRFAVLDDEIELLMGCVPRRSLFRCDPYHGLTSEVTDQIIRHFQA